MFAVAAAAPVIPNEQGNRITPSYVAWDSASGERLVGDAAKNQASLNAANTVFDIKRFIGRKFSDKTVEADRALLPYRIVDKGGLPEVEVELKEGRRAFPPEAVSAMVLGHLKSVAEKYLGEDVKDAVVTVPAYFSDAQRKATRAAGQIAGLNVLRVFNEPTAAALAYGLNNNAEQNILVFDLGGGTFDVTLLTIDNGVFEVLATNGDTHLGGEDFDQRVMQYLIKLFLKHTKIDISSDKRAMQRLRSEVERAKRELSSNKKVAIEIENLSKDTDMKETLSRARFEELNADLFAKVLGPMEKVLDDAELMKGEVDRVVLVGGSTRIPKVRATVASFFKGHATVIDSASVNPDEAVAHGAALQGAILSGKSTETSGLLLLDVTPLSLGMEVLDGQMEVVIKRNTAIPTRKVREFTTQLEGQTSLSNRIYEGERPHVKHNHKLGEFLLEGIVPQPKGVPRIEMTFEVDANGILAVTAKDLAGDGGAKNSIVISSDEARLTEEQIRKMMEEAERFKEEDAKALARRGARHALEALLYSAREKLASAEVDDARAVDAKEVVEEAL